VRRFRMYSEIIDDLKIKEMTDSQFRMFVYLLSFACECDRDGFIPHKDKEIAWRIRRQRRQALRCIEISSGDSHHCPP